MLLKLLLNFNLGPPPHVGWRRTAPYYRGLQSDGLSYQLGQLWQVQSTAWEDVLGVQSCLQCRCCAICPSPLIRCGTIRPPLALQWWRTLNVLFLCQHSEAPSLLSSSNRPGSCGSISLCSCRRNSRHSLGGSSSSPLAAGAPLASSTETPLAELCAIARLSVTCHRQRDEVPQLAFANL